MTRSRYWKLTVDEVQKMTYEPKKMLFWEIKGVREPADEAKFIGVFSYRNGTPLDYTPINGIVYYYNNIDRKELPEITKFLKKRFGGKVIEKGDRVFLQGSKEIYSGKEIAELARDFENKFNTKSEITLEFQDITEQEKREGGLPDGKLLPIPGNK